MKGVSFSVEYLKTCLKYDKETGLFEWQYRKDKPNNWNGRFAGKSAGGLSTSGYITIAVNAVPFYAHRLAWVFEKGDIPKGWYIDHINRNKLDNRLSNLRLASPEENSVNCTSQTYKTSRYKGVYKSRKLYSSQITKSGRCTSLVCDVGEEIAAAYYNYAASLLFGEFAVYNDTPVVLGDLEKTLIESKLFK